MRFFVQDTEEFENNGIEYKSLDKAIIITKIKKKGGNPFLLF